MTVATEFYRDIKRGRSARFLVVRNRDWKRNREYRMHGTHTVVAGVTSFNSKIYNQSKTDVYASYGTVGSDLGAFDARRNDAPKVPILRGETRQKSGVLARSALFCRKVMMIGSQRSHKLMMLLGCWCDYQLRP